MTPKFIQNLFNPKNQVKYGFLVIIAVYFAMIPSRALAFASLNDGGMLMGQDSQCSCSGGNTVRVQSYVDNSMHTYLYDPKVTRLDMNYNINQTGNYFLTTLIPFAICLDSSEECEGSSGQSPEGEFLEVGTSFKTDPNSVFALFNDMPKKTLKSQLSAFANGINPLQNIELPKL